MESPLWFNGQSIVVHGGFMDRTPTVHEPSMVVHGQSMDSPCWFDGQFHGQSMDSPW